MKWLLPWLINLWIPWKPVVIEKPDSYFEQSLPIKYRKFLKYNGNDHRQLLITTGFGWILYGEDTQELKDFINFLILFHGLLVEKKRGDNFWETMGYFFVLSLKKLPLDESKINYILKILASDINSTVNYHKFFKGIVQTLMEDNSLEAQLFWKFLLTNTHPLVGSITKNLLMSLVIQHHYFPIIQWVFKKNVSISPWFFWYLWVPEAVATLEYYFNNPLVIPMALFHWQYYGFFNSSINFFNFQLPMVQDDFIVMGQTLQDDYEKQLLEFFVFHRN
jgi:hypothetical protein